MKRLLTPVSCNSRSFHAPSSKRSPLGYFHERMLAMVAGHGMPVTVSSKW
jgi:hypothetical protein